MRIWVLTICLSAGTAFGAPSAKKSGGSARVAFEQAAVEFGLKGQLDLDKDDDTVAFVELTLGYFLIQGLELGLKTLQGTTPSGLRDANGIFVEWDFVNAGQFVPFFGAAVRHAAPPVGEDNQRDAILGTAYFGNNLIVAPNAALSFTAQIDYSTEDVYGQEAGARKKRNREANLGLRFFF